MRDARLACCLEHQDWIWKIGEMLFGLVRLLLFCIIDRISLCKIQSLLEFESLLYIEK